jgi:DNA-binding transcriptional regulator YhcF (GntR family)
MKKIFYKELADQILADYAPGGSLPGERILAERYVCTRSTVRAALKKLTETGHLKSSPRQGHSIVGVKEVVREKRMPCNIVMFTERHKLDDQNFLDFVAGVIHQSKEKKLNLVIREIDENLEAATAADLEQFHDGIEADGYLLAGCASERLRAFLENVFKPCVVLGVTGVSLPVKRRFMEVCLPRAEHFNFVFKKLFDMGHRKILSVSNPSNDILDIAEKYIRDNALTGYSVDVLFSNLPKDAATPCFNTAEEVFAGIKGHTALFLPFGGATALAIYRTLLESGIRIPEDLSLIVECGRYDYFAKVFDIDHIYSSAWEEGCACIDELALQFSSGKIRFGSKTSNYIYVGGSSLAEVCV